jgi:hypothetical protein
LRQYWLVTQPRCHWGGLASIAVAFTINCKFHLVKFCKALSVGFGSGKLFQRIIVSLVLLSGLVLAVQALGKEAQRQEFKLASEHTGVATP